MKRTELEVAACTVLSGQGDNDARFQLGVFHWTGVGNVRVDHEESVRLWKLAAANGNAKSQYVLASCYRRGLGGLERNEEVAGVLFRESLPGLWYDAVNGDETSGRFIWHWARIRRLWGGRSVLDL